MTDFCTTVVVVDSPETTNATFDTNNNNNAANSNCHSTTSSVSTSSHSPFVASVVVSVGSEDTPDLVNLLRRRMCQAETNGIDDKNTACRLTHHSRSISFESYCTGAAMISMPNVCKVNAQFQEYDDDRSRRADSLCRSNSTLTRPSNDPPMKYFESTADTSHRVTVEVNADGFAPSSGPPRPPKPRVTHRNGHELTPSVTNDADGTTTVVLHRSEIFCPPSTSTAAQQVLSTTQPSTRSSTSSAYSGSLSHSTAAEIDDELAGLPETTVDSDDDDDESCPSGDSLMDLRDVVRMALEKEPPDRTDDDLRVLLDFMQHMPAFANMPVGVKRQLCQHMVFALVERAGDVVMKDGEQLDSWCVLVNGEIEVTVRSHRDPNQFDRVQYHLGDSFGVEPRPEPQYHRGEMRALVDDCQFVLVAQTDYVKIMSTVTEHLQKHKNAAGEIVSETERRILDQREGFVLIKGKPETLLAHLVDDRDNSIDPYYVEDFLLMYRTFIDKPTIVFERMQKWFDEQMLRDKVARLVLLWVNNHFNDFETSSEMMDLLQQFEQALDREGMQNHQSLLNIACSVKSRVRTVTYTRSERDEVLHFSLLGGFDRDHGLFISKVAPGSQAERVGLKRGDELLQVNGQNFQHLSHQRALELLRASTHLSIMVKSNLLGFKEMLAASDGVSATSTATTSSAGSASSRSRSSGAGARISLLPSATGTLPAAGTRSCGQLPPPHVRQQTMGSPRLPPHHMHASGSSSTAHYLVGVSDAQRTPPPGSNLAKIRSIINRIRIPSFSTLPPPDSDVTVGELADQGRQQRAQQQHPQTQLKHSRSNPDISGNHVQNPQSATAGFAGDNISQYYKPVRPANPEHVLKIYRSDQTFKYLTVYKETTAQNVVQLALQEFGMNDASSTEWALCECTVDIDNGMIRRRRLHDATSNLAERIALNSRYYLKNTAVDEQLFPDHLAPELVKEAQTQLLQLNAQMLAAQLTLQDFAVFAAIEPTEYVDNLFGTSITSYGWPKLTHFEELVNREMWWVATEICKERSAIKRAKLIKKFIKIARHCREFRNFNSMFAVMSGLEKPSVRRLHHTWDKVPSKYMRMFEDLQQLMDPSRNMSKYRQHLANVAAEPPVVPLFPVIKKDLTFIHEGNATTVDGLINFEKLRMIAKEIRTVVKYASSPYELNVMGGGRLNEALLNMNSFDGGANVATIRKPYAQKASTQPRKKLYEQALMVRKVKSYLSNLEIIDVEPELDRLSSEIEPAVSGSSAGGGSSSSQLLAPSSRLGRRQPSPSPSGGSGQSDKRRMQQNVTAPKFGVESPHAVQKMLALVDHSKKRAATPPFAPHHSSSSLNPPPFGSPTGGVVRRANRVLRRSSAAAISVPSMSAGIADFAVIAATPMDLTAECSSVTGALTQLRLSSSGSITSTDSCPSSSTLRQSTAVAPVGLSHAVSCDSTDSGHASLASQRPNGGSPESPLSSRRVVGSAARGHRVGPHESSRVSGGASHHHHPPMLPRTYANVKIPSNRTNDTIAENAEQISRV